MSEKNRKTMKPESEYLQLEKELRPFQSLMAKATETILDQEVSSYPIFIIHRQGVNIGIPLLEPGKGGNPWGINASTLEELATKKVIAMEKVDGFREVYKNPQDYFCLFVLREEGASFVFMPREAE